MLEARLLVKLVRTQAYWEVECNDMEMLTEVKSMAIGTDWESKIADIIGGNFPEANAYRVHILQGITCLIDELANTIDDKIRRRNLQIAELKKQAGRPDLTQQITRLAGKIGRAGAILADIERGLLDNDFPGGKILGEILAKRIEEIRDELRGKSVPPSSDLEREPEKFSARLNRATSLVNGIIAEINAINADDLSVLEKNIKQALGKINLALLG